MNSVFISIVYLASTIVEIILLMQIKKNKEKLEFTRWLLMTTILLMAIDTLAVGIIDVCKVPINLLTVSAVHVIACVLLFFYNKKHVSQEYYFDVLSGVAEIIIAVAVIVYFFQLKDISHAPAFNNTDAAVHFNNAMQLVRSGHLSWMYFAPLMNTIAIELFAPTIKQIEYIKVFTVVDLLFFIFEIEFLWVIVNKKCESCIKKIVCLVLVFIYAAQYPLSTFLYNFIYLGMAVLFISALVVLAEDVDRKEHKYELFIGWGLILYAVTMSYMLLAPFAFLAVFLFEAYREIKVRENINAKQIIKVALIMVIPAVLALWFGFYKLTGGRLSNVQEIAVMQGNCYKEYYWQFVWLVPFVTYDGIKSIQKKKVSFEWIAQIAFLLAVVVLTVMVLHNLFSAYYFYKLYYPLFAFSTIIASSAIVQMIDEKNALFPSMIAMMSIPFVMHFGGIEKKLVENPSNLQMENHSDTLFGMWNHSEDMRKRNKPIFSEPELDGISYIIENFSEENVPMMALIDDIYKCWWYEYISDNDSSEFYGWTHDYEEILGRLDNKEIKYFCVMKDTVFNYYYEGFLEDYSIVYENPGLVVYSTEKK